jgi:hypothetical protein
MIEKDDGYEITTSRILYEIQNPVSCQVPRSSLGRSMTYAHFILFLTRWTSGDGLGTEQLSPFVP